MNCRISYIDKENISETEKQRLFSIHTNIFSKAKESGDFRNFDGKLYTLKEGYSKGVSFVAGINKEYSTPVAKINTKSPGQHYLSVDVLPLAIGKQEVLFQKSNVPITSTSSLRTFDFGSLEGQPQTAAKNKAIHNNIINIPDELMSEEGETFNQAERRVINELKDIVKTAPNNTLVVTHNSVFGVIKLWNNEGRPDSFNKEQRIKYTEQDNKFHTGEHFTIKGDNGTIYIARHGATEDNEKGVFRTKNVKLAPEGIEQAEELGKSLENIKISKVLSSPLPRAIQTSNLVLAEQKVEKYPSPDPSKELVNFLKTVHNNPLSEDIIYNLSSPDMILTGSLALSTQGSIYRDKEYGPHDLDFISQTLTEEEVNKIINSNYKNTKQIYSFSRKDGTKVLTYIIPPKGTRVDNITRNNKTKVNGYNLRNSKGEIVGKYTYENEGKEKILGPKAVIVDVFINKNDKRQASSYDFKTKDGREKVITLSRYNSTFAAKDKLNRPKDKFDKENFELSEEFQNKITPSLATDDTIKRVKEAAKRMGIDIQKLNEYAKKSGIETEGINALANLTKGVIAIAEGKESEAITEETIHIATAILEQTNPKMVTEMISKIEKFQMYKRVYNEYKDTYILPNGKPDIRKIKKEAVDRLIAEIIVNNNENLDQNPELREEINQSLVKGWWNSILQWIKSLYTKANIDIFKQAASDILTKDIGTVSDIKGEGTFYQLSDKQKDIQQKLANTQNKIEKVVEDNKTSDPLLLDSEEANNFYRVQKEDGTWEKVTKRVTDRVKAWYKQRFGNKVFTAQEKEFNELKRKYGVEGHADFEEIHTRYYNEDGTKREIPLEKPDKFNLPSREMYDKLEKYYVGLVNTFPKDTLIFSEVIIYDEKQKEAGTIDFLAVEPSGKTSIFDWKFMNFGKNQEDVAWYKQGAYNVQIGRYKEILNKEYGIKEFGQLRAIPITMNFENKDKKDKKSPLQLKSIGIGNVNPSSMEPLTQLPIAEESESTGIEALDNIIKRLNAHLRQVSKEKTTNEEDKQFKIERLNILNKAIRHAHITHNVVPLIQVIEVMRKEGDRILDDYNLSYKNRPASLADSTDSELSDFAEEMRDYIKLSEVFVDIGDDLGGLIYDDQQDKENPTEAEKADALLRKQYLDMLEKESRLIRKSQKEIRKAALAFADKHIGERNLVTGLLKPEKIVKGLGSLFRGVSELPLRSLEILHKLTRAAQGKASTDALKEITSLMDIRKKIAEKGVDIRDFIKQIYQKDDKGKLVNKLILKYDSKFFKDIDEKSTEGGDKQWLKDNINIEEYKKEAQKVIDRQIDIINKTRYNGSPEEEELIRGAEKARIKRLYDIDREDFNGWNNYILKRHPLDKWYSEEYKNVLKDNDLLELYSFVVDFNEKAKDIGYLQNKAASTFLPFIRKSMAEQLSFDGELSPINAFQKSLQINVDDVGYGNINEVTGELENSIPKYYTHDFTKTEGVNDYSQVSEDLFKNLILYIQQVEKYKYMSKIEGQLKLVKTIEEFKTHLNTGRTGDVIMKDGKPEELPGNAENTKMFDDFLRVLVYDQRYVLSDSDTPLQLDKALNFVKKAVNSVAGKEVWKESEKPTATSLMKTIDAANRGFQLKTLGFEFISGAVNWFGSNIQIATQAGNYFKSREFAKNEAKLIGQKFANEEDKELFIQLVDTFMPLKDDPSYELYKQAGLTNLTRLNLGDTLMIFMRKPEQLVEKAVFLSLLQNTMVIDGKIVSIREFVKNKYKDRYNSAESYNQVKDKIEQEIEELKKTSSIDATKKLEDGKLVIPGLNLKDRNELQRLTNLSRKLSENATGAMTKENINRMSMSIWTKSMMIFKNWIPKLADTRFSEFRKVSDDFSVRINEDGIAEGAKYDIGRIRLLGYILSDGVFRGVQNVKNIIWLNSQGLARLDELFEEFKQKYESETGETLNMSREDFIDLIRTNLRNQLKELAIFATLIGIAISLGFMAPDDDEDKATKNFFRYSQKVLDKFVNELSFFYNPADWESLLSGGIFPAIGIIEDFQKFIVHFFQQTTGLDFDPNTSYDDVRKKAHPIKYAMKALPITKSALTYASIFSSQFAEEFDITIQKNANNR